MRTTLNLIREKEPCKSGWEKLLRHLGKTRPDDEPLALAEILRSNGLDDAIWCLVAVDGADRDARLFAVWCARQVQHLMAGKRSIAALDVTERFENGVATEKERDAASAAAWDAAMEKDNATALAAARGEYMGAALVSAWVVALASARGAASAAAWASAWASAKHSARDSALVASRGSALISDRGAQLDMFLAMCEGKAPWQNKEK